MRSLSILAHLLVLLVLIGLGMQNRELKNELDEEVAGRHLPRVGDTLAVRELLSLDGRALRLGEAVPNSRQVIVHLSSKCPASRSSAKFIAAIAESLTREGVEVIGLTAEPDSADLRAHLAEFGLQFPVAAGVARRDLRAYRLHLTPMLVAVDQAGTIEALKIGAVESNEDAFEFVQSALPMERDSALTMNEVP